MARNEEITENELRKLLEKVADSDTGTRIEKALFRLKTVMDAKADEDIDVMEMGKRCYADLCQAKKALGEEGGILDVFFAMFRGVFASIPEDQLDPDYQYVEDDMEKYEPEFTLLAVIPLSGDLNNLETVKAIMRSRYPQYEIINGNTGIALRAHRDYEDSHFFVSSQNGTICSISYVEEEGKMDSMKPLLDNTEDLTDEERNEIVEKNQGCFLEVYLAPEAGITLSKDSTEEGLSSQMEKAEMAVRLIASALEAPEALGVFTNGRVYRCDEYESMISDLDDSDFMPADLFAYTYMEKVDEDENAIMTMGLSSYGFLEMIAITSDDDLEREEMFCAIQDLVNYILQRGEVINDGDVLSYDGRARYSFKFENLDGQPVFRVRRLRPDDDVDVFSMLSEYHGPISWNRYEGLTCPLSFYWNDKKIVILFHIPGCEASYEGFMSEYTYLLDNLTFIFEGIKDFFKSPEALNHHAIKSYMKRLKVKKADVEKTLLELKPTDVFLDPTVDSIKEGAPMLTVRYRERKNSRSFIEIGIDSDVQLAGIASI